MSSGQPWWLPLQHNGTSELAFLSLPDTTWCSFDGVPQNTCRTQLRSHSYIYRDDKGLFLKPNQGRGSPSYLHHKMRVWSPAMLLVSLWKKWLLARCINYLFNVTLIRHGCTNSSHSNSGVERQSVDRHMSEHVMTLRHTCHHGYSASWIKAKHVTPWIQTRSVLSHMFSL